MVRRAGLGAASAAARAAWSAAPWRGPGTGPGAASSGPLASSPPWMSSRRQGAIAPVLREGTPSRDGGHRKQPAAAQRSAGGGGCPPGRGDRLRRCLRLIRCSPCPPPFSCSLPPLLSASCLAVQSWPTDTPDCNAAWVGAAV